MQQELDEAFRLAIGAGGVGTRAPVPQVVRGAVLILGGAAIVLMRRRDATVGWLVGVLLLTVGALFVLYVVTAILSGLL